MDLEFATFDISEGIRPYLSESDIDILSRQGLPVLHNSYCFRALKRLDAHSFLGCVLFAGHPATSFMGVDLQTGQVWECRPKSQRRLFANSSLSQYVECVITFVSDAPYDASDEGYPENIMRVADQFRDAVRVIDSAAIEGLISEGKTGSTEPFWEDISWEITTLDWSTEAFNEPVADE